jgi:hypothetical protein
VELLVRDVAKSPAMANVAIVRISALALFNRRLDGLRVSRFVVD